MKQAFEGICNNIERRYKETQSDASRKELEELMSECPCPDCKGRRLRKESLAVTVGEKNIYEFTTLSVEDALIWMDGLTLTEQQMLIADRILKEIRSRLGFLKSVGLGYLTLARSAGTSPARASGSDWPPRSALGLMGGAVYFERAVHRAAPGTTISCWRR